MFDLTKHDARFHKDGYKDGDNCMYRQAIKDYESVDDLSAAGKISDALEDAELLEQQIGKMKNENVKSRLREHQKAAMSRAKQHLPKNMSPKKPLSHDESAFPSVNDTDWQDALANYGNSRYGWHSAGSGSTCPHYIDFNGKRYFVKKAGMNSSYRGDACKNEVNANQFIRMAGFNAPDGKFYQMGSGDFAVAEAADLSGGTLASGVGDKKIREAVADAYPLMALMYNMDIMQNADNAFIDANGNPVFLDNGSTFGFSAQGARNKYYDFDDRTDPFPKKSTSGGLTGLLDVGNNGSHEWNKFLSGKTSKDDLLKLCAKYNMSALVEAGEKKGLIPWDAVPALKDYAKKLDILSDKYRDKSQQQEGSQYKVSPAAAFWQSVGRPDLEDVQQAGSDKKTQKSGKSSEKNVDDQSGKSDEEKIADLAKKHGVSVPKMTKNSDGTITLSGFGNATTKQMLDFIHDLNDSGLLPGFIASLSGSGQVQVQSAINQGNASSVFGGLFSGLSFSGGGFGGSTSLSRGSLNGVSTGGFSFSGGLNSSSAQSLANQFNQNNANSGYTAKATQTSTGEWQVTLYPTDQKKIAKAFSSDDGNSYSSMSSSGVSHGNQASNSNSSSGSSSSSSSSSHSSGSSGSSGSSSGSHQSSRPSRPHSSSGGSSSGSQSSSAPSKPSTPAPNINTQTPQQVAATVAQMPKAAAGAFVNMLKNREANPATPAGLKAKYQRILSLLGHTSSSPTAPTSQSPQTQPTATGGSTGGNPSISAAALALTSPLAKRLQNKLAINKPGTPYYNNLVNQLNKLAGVTTA